MYIYDVCKDARAIKKKKKLKNRKKDDDDVRFDVGRLKLFNLVLYFLRHRIEISHQFKISSNLIRKNRILAQKVFQVRTTHTLNIYISIYMRDYMSLHTYVCNFSMDNKQMKVFQKNSTSSYGSSSYFS